MRKLLMALSLLLVMVLTSPNLGTSTEIPYTEPGGGGGDDHPWGGDSVADDGIVVESTRPRYSASTGFWGVDLYFRAITNPKVLKLILQERKYLQTTGTTTGTNTGATQTRNLTR